MLTAGYGTAAVVLPYLLVGVRPSMPDVVAGGTLLVCGFLLVDGGDRRLGRLITLGGVASFAPGFAPVFTEGALRSVLEATSLVYLAFLTHAAVTVCDPGLARRVSRPVMVAGYGVAAAAATTLAQPGLMLLGVAMAVTALDTVRRPASARLETRWLAPAAAVVLAAGLLLAAGLRLASTPLTEPTISRILVLAVTSMAVLCVAASARQDGASTPITLDANASSALATEIGRLSGQGSVAVVFPAPEPGSWIDFAGLPVAVEGADLMIVGDRGVPSRRCSIGPRSRAWWSKT